MQEGGDDGEPLANGLESDQRRLAEQAHALVDEVVSPCVEASREAEWNAPPSRRVPWELLRAVDDTGLRTLGLPTGRGQEGGPILRHQAVATRPSRHGDPGGGGASVGAPRDVRETADAVIGSPVACSTRCFDRSPDSTKRESSD